MRVGTSASCGFFLSCHTRLYLMCLLGCQPGSSATIIRMAAVCSPCITFVCSLSSWAWSLAVGTGQPEPPLWLCGQKKKPASRVSTSTCLSHHVCICSGACNYSALAGSVDVSTRAFYVSGTLTIWLCRLPAWCLSNFFTTKSSSIFAEPFHFFFFNFLF